MFRRTLVFLCAVYLIVLFLFFNIFPLVKYYDENLEDEILEITGNVREIHFKNEKWQIYLGDVFFEYNSQKKYDMGAVVYLGKDTEIPGIGSKITVRGKYHNFEAATNPGQFDAGRYYQLKGIDFSLTDCNVKACKNSGRNISGTLYGVRIWAENILEAYYSQENAGILKAMLLGDKDGLSEEVKDLFEKSGCAHVLCISGTHIGIIGMALYRLLYRILHNRKFSGATAMVFIILYGLMTGMGAATSRAVIMFGIGILSDITGRDYDLITALSVAASAALIINPLLIYDAGFLMSFGAVLGIGLIYPVVKYILPDMKWNCADSVIPGGIVKVVKGLYDGFEVSLSITVFTLPLMLFFYFGFSVFSVIINLIIIPLMGILLVTGIVSILCGGLHINLITCVFSTLTSLILDLYKFVCQKTVSIPGNSFIAGKPQLLKITVYYTILLIVIMAVGYVKKRFLCKKKTDIKIKTIILIRTTFAVLCIISIMILCINIKTGFSFGVLDVGQGDCILFSVNDKSFLVDCGSTDRKSVGKYILIPALKAMGIKRLEGIFISHGDADHVNGIMELLSEGVNEGIEVERVFVTNNTYYSKTGEEIKNITGYNYPNAKIEIFEEGRKIVTEGLQIECLLPHKNERGDANELSMVMLLRYGKFSALLSGDVEGTGEDALSNKIHEAVTIYKVAHHGSKGTNGDSLLKKMRPFAAVISAGKNNSYGHPHKETLRRLADIKSRIFVTINSGAVFFRSNGYGLKVDCYK